MVKAVEGTTSPQQQRRASALRVTPAVFAVMITVLIVAVVFAANQNDIIGWLVVVIAGGWLALAAFAFLSLRRGAKKVSDQMGAMAANTAHRSEATVGASGQAGAGQVAADPMRDTKLDHSLKIVQVQVRVVTEELAKGESADREMIDRALDTMNITASNARDMIRESRGESGTSGSAGEGPVSGTVVD